MYLFKLIHRKIFFAVSLLGCLLLLFYTYNLIVPHQSSILNAKHILLFNASKYLVNSLKCKILDLDPFDPEVKRFHKPQKYFPCRELELLTYLTKDNNVATLHVNTTVIPSYTKHEVACSYSTIKRRRTKYDPDNSIKESPYQSFKDNVTLGEDFVAVECTESNSRRIIYQNAHATVTIKKNIMKRLQVFDKKSRPFSVLFIGIDSISRLNFIRNLPNSHKFLMDNNWITLKGYNKMGDNTFPNIMAILTGYNESSAFNKCDPTILNMLDYCPMIWNDFRKFGYVTAFAEDESWISTFNCNKKGFNHQPTDYYFRPYFLKTESFRIVWKDDTKYCTGPEPAGERLLNVIKEFGVAFLERPSFGFFWTNSFSHNSLNAASGMDDKIKQFFEDITNAGILENSIVIFLSDHGLRCGEFRETTMGWLEERLPFIYIWIPEKFQKKFPAEFTNIKRKVDKLTSPFDLYMTLQHLLVLSDFNYVMKPSSGCSNCKSLFIETGSERSCEDAGIAQHWCTCADFSPVDGEVQKIVNKASYYFTEQINGIIHNNREGEKCAAYSFHKIVKTGVIKSYKDEKYLLLAIETKPKAFFETTLAYHKHENEDEYFEIKGGISRTDRYAPHSQCTQDTILKKYCHCKLNNTNI